MLYSLALILLTVSPSLALWPLPASYSNGTTALVLSPSFDVDISTITSPPKDLIDAISRTKKRLVEDKLERLVPDHGASDLAILKDASSLESLILTLPGDPTPISEVATAELGKRDEAYSLTVPSDGSPATISAATTLGLFRGLTTFEQLWYTRDKLIYTLEAPYNIEDAPRYVRHPIFFKFLLFLITTLPAISRLHARYLSQLVRFLSPILHPFKVQTHP